MPLQPGFDVKTEVNENRCFKGKVLIYAQLISLYREVKLIDEQIYTILTILLYVGTCTQMSQPRSYCLQAGDCERSLTINGILYRD